MKTVNLTNKSGGLIVCDLKGVNGKNIRTLRLKNNQSETCREDEVTPHIENLIAKGLVRREDIKTAEKSESGEKTETKKGKGEV